MLHADLALSALGKVYNLTTSVVQDWSLDKAYKLNFSHFKMSLFSSADWSATVETGTSLCHRWRLWDK